MNRSLREIVGITVVLLTTVAFFGKLLTGRYVWYEGGPDIVWQVMPWLQVQAAALHHGEFALWDPNQLGGESLLGQIQPGIFNPLQYVLLIPVAISGHITLPGFETYFVFLHVCVALAAYALFRSIGISPLSSALGALFYAIASVGGNVGWPQVLSSMVYPPLVLLFLIRVARDINPLSSAAFAGVLLGVSWYSGHHAVPILLTLGVALSAVVLFLIRRREFRRLLVQFALIAFVAGSIALPQIWAAIEFSQRSWRWVGADHPILGSDRVPYAFASVFVVKPSGLLNILIPGDLSLKNPFAGWQYVGMLGCALCALALVRIRSDRNVRIFSILALAGLLYAMGPYGLIQRIAYLAIPFAEKLREPVFALVFFGLGAAGLIALGFDRLLAWIDLRAAYHLTGLAAPAILALALLTFFVEQSRVSGKSPQTKLLPIQDAKLTQGLWRTRDVADWLEHRPDLVRIAVNGSELSYDLGDWYGFEELSGYAPAIFKPFVDLQWWRLSVRRLYGANYYVAFEPAESNQTEVYHDPSGLRVFSTPGVFPRSWVVHKVIETAPDANLDPFLDNPSFPLSETAFIEKQAPGLTTCVGKDQVHVVTRSLNAVELQANLACRGMVILSDNNYPGWVATVDSRPATLYYPYVALRGVVAEAGSHTIRMEYRPKYLTIGAPLAIFGLLLAAALVLLEQRKLGRNRARSPIGVEFLLTLN